MEVEHFSHPDHSLILISEVIGYIGEDVICSGCEEPISGPCYSCSSCFFFLHKKCAELPLEIKRQLHPHPLSLLAKPQTYYIRCICDLCFKICRSFVYNCDLCEFDLDIRCALPPCFFEADSKGCQFSHNDHPLTLKEEQENHGGGVMCSACKEPVLSGPTYSCTATACNLFLHNKCAELPQEIKRHLHPEHPLLLLKEAPPYTFKEWVCDFCNKTCNDCFVYHCFVCDFNLHIQCAFPPCIYEADQDQGHQFRCLLRSIPLKSLSFTCSACGTGGEELPFMCTICQLLVHKKCMSLKQTIKIRQHHHFLNHTYFPQEDESGKPYCGVCQIQFKWGHGVYQCKNCNFFAHVNCALEFDSSKRVATYNESMDSISPTAFEIKHFSHEHSLNLIDEFNDNIKCDGCLLPFSNPFYGCRECHFYLHEACSELPRHRNFRDIQLSLFTKADTVDGNFRCNLCAQYCHGFVYCNNAPPLMNIDVRCCIKASSGIITHEGHKHQLFVSDGVNVDRCSACSDESNRFLFRCVICDFKLNFRCATLPHEARHEYDEHSLFLTYTDPNDYQFVCIICEKERDPKLWFYRCEECDFDAHPECVLGKDPFIKLGGSYTYDIHPHPLCLVEKTEFDNHPACHFCGESCDDLALECTDSGCNFVIHRKGRCRSLLRRKIRRSFSTREESGI